MGEMISMRCTETGIEDGRASWQLALQTGVGRLTAVAIVVEGLWEVPEVIEESEAQAESWDEKGAVVCHARSGGCWRASADSRSDSNEVRELCAVACKPKW